MLVYRCSKQTESHALDCDLLSCDLVLPGRLLLFWRKMPLPFSGYPQGRRFLGHVGTVPAYEICCEE
jgi:hypothetical protein